MAYKYTENLDRWENLPPTNMCYLPGNYFNMVFARYPGLLKNPLYIRLIKGRRGVRKYVNMRETGILNTKIPGMLRVVIDTGVTKHSNLVILDFENGRAYRFEPLGVSGPYFAEVNDIIEDYLNAFFNFELEVIEVEIDEMYDEKNPLCKKSGYCAAYNILYGYCFLNQKPFKPHNIRRFCTKIIDVYGEIPVEQHEVEMQGFLGNPNPNQARNAAIGGIGGLAVGAALGGLPLAAAGGLAGLGVGALV